MAGRDPTSRASADLCERRPCSAGIAGSHGSRDPGTPQLLTGCGVAAGSAPVIPIAERAGGGSRLCPPASRNTRPIRRSPGCLLRTLGTWTYRTTRMRSSTSSWPSWSPILPACRCDLRLRLRPGERAHRRTRSDGVRPRARAPDRHRAAPHRLLSRHNDGERSADDRRLAPPDQDPRSSRVLRVATRVGVRSRDRPIPSSRPPHDAARTGAGTGRIANRCRGASRTGHWR